jgi:transcriptional regulator with GAF, ATPase, and Fis domain
MAPGHLGQPKAGRFALPHRRTLFLDEVADIPVEQAQLLRVLPEQEFERYNTAD